MFGKSIVYLNIIYNFKVILVIKEFLNGLGVYDYFKIMNIDFLR